MSDVATFDPVVVELGPAGSAPPLVSVFDRRGRVAYLAGAALWVAALAWFWVWWLDPAHDIGLAPYLVVTVTLAWLTLLPLYFIVIYFGARRPAGPLALPDGTRVAMVVTKAPSEPFAVVAATLEAMLAQDYPHHTWLADEDPSEATIAWCAARGIGISTRRGVADYHRKTWPRRTRCKEGNLAFFYDHFGYDNYDIVSQLDADHVPEPGYLRQMLRPFGDPRIGYVSAPSICDSNAAQSWSARGRLYVEASMHGALQAGYNGGWAPLCIGSHYAVRTKALREIGGLGPELAEDHSTTLMMNAHGWRGVHALDAIAHGEGPNSFADLITQEFQWSRSLMTILLRYSPIYVPMLPARLRFQFLFSQAWYPLFSLFMALSFAMPIIALIRGTTFVDISYPAFLVHFAPLTLVLIALAFQWRAGGTFRPFDAKIVSWEGLVFLFARWPWTLAGSVAAIYERVTDKYVDFRVTPKGRDAVAQLPFRVLAPYAALSLASALTALLVTDAGPAAGFYVFAAFNAVVYAAIFILVIVRHARENGGARRSLRRAPALAVAALGLLALPGAAMAQHGLDGLGAVAAGAGYFALTQTTTSISGAGREAKLRTFFNPRWTFGHD